MMRTDYQRIHLENLRDGFGIDVEPAQHLSGEALDAWLNQAEDEWFLAAMMELASQRVPVPTGPITLPPVGGVL